MLVKVKFTRLAQPQQPISRSYYDMICIKSQIQQDLGREQGEGSRVKICLFDERPSTDDILAENDFQEPGGEPDEDVSGDYKPTPDDE
eukprot:IDg4929t1